VGPCWCDKNAQQTRVYVPPQLLARHALYIVGYRNHIQIGPYDCQGACNVQGSKAKHACQVRAAQSNQSEGRSDTKGGQHLAHSGPH
jgi:hypothetical protein